jgi:beta-carotene ketolase (CrtO type)
VSELDQIRGTSSSTASRSAASVTPAAISGWVKYAPNMTRDNVIAQRVYTPNDIERERPNMVEGGYSTGSTIGSQLGRFRPVPELAGYRVVLENLYDCSANRHSGSGAGRGSSYNRYQEIARVLQREEASVAA